MEKWSCDMICRFWVPVLFELATDEELLDYKPTKLEYAKLYAVDCTKRHRQYEELYDTARELGVETLYNHFDIMAYCFQMKAMLMDERITSCYYC
jgi:hypothetical protein